MWENETIVLVISLKKRILGENGRVQFSKIAEDQAIPPYVKSVFKKHVENFVAEETPFSFQSTLHFDLQPDVIKQLKKRFLDIFWEVSSFQEKEVEDILKEALILRLNYILKPIDTMGKRLFEKKSTVGFSEMKNLLDSFKEILPYAGQLLDVCGRDEKKSVDKEEYRKLVNSVIYPALEKSPVQMVMRDFTVLTEFLSEAKGEEILRIEGNDIQEFLADRNLWSFRRALDVEMKLGKKEFNMVDLEMTLKRYLELRDEFKKTGVSYEQAESEEVDWEKTENAINEPTAEEEISQEEMISQEESWNLDKVMAEEVLPVNIEIEKEKKEQKQKIQEEKPKTMRIIRREQLKEAREETEKDEEGEKENVLIQDVRNSIDGKTEATFVKKLFGGNEKEYKQLLSKLEEAESWRMAKILIDNELFKRDVDPFSREAIKLVDIVYSLYYPEEGVGGK